MTTATTILRRYGPAERWCGLGSVCGDDGAIGIRPWSWDDDMRTIPRTYLDSGGEFIVGELEGCIVAHAAFLREPEGWALVRRVAVHPAVQRRGIGQMLMAKLEANARQQGIMALQTHADVPPALASRGHVLVKGSCERRS